MDVVLSAHRGRIAQSVGDRRYDLFCHSLAGGKLIERSLLIEESRSERRSLPRAEVLSREMMASTLVQILVDGNRVGHMNLPSFVNVLKHVSAAKLFELGQQADKPLFFNNNFAGNSGFGSEAKSSPAGLNFDMPGAKSCQSIRAVLSNIFFAADANRREIEQRYHPGKHACPGQIRSAEVARNVAAQAGKKLGTSREAEKLRQV